MVPNDVTNVEKCEFDEATKPSCGISDSVCHVREIRVELFAVDERSAAVSQVFVMTMHVQISDK